MKHMFWQQEKVVFDFESIVKIFYRLMNDISLLKYQKIKLKKTYRVSIATGRRCHVVITIC